MNQTALPRNNSVRDFLHQFLVGIFAVLIAVNVVPGITYDSTMDLLLASLVLGALNAFLRPFLLLGCLPLLILTLGLFLMVINAMLLLLTAKLVDGFHITGGFWPAFWGALVISIVTVIANTLTGNGNSKVQFQRRQPKQHTPQSGKKYDHDDDDGPVVDV
jgi:putative membrane protein